MTDYYIGNMIKTIDETTLEIAAQMRNNQKREVILDFLKEISEKDCEVEVDKLLLKKD